MSDAQFWSPKKPQMYYKYIEDFSRLAEGGSGEKQVDGVPRQFFSVKLSVKGQ